MRLWSLHPSLLDRAALVAGWRESLLAQKVLAGGTTGYTRHPQLLRFREHAEPLEAIGAYLSGLQAEATVRGYRFDASRISRPSHPDRPARLADLGLIPATDGQLRYELEHLRRKVISRAPDWLPRLPEPQDEIPAHPLLRSVLGDVEAWEVR